MADKTIKIDIQTNMAEVLQKQTNLTKAIALMTANLNTMGDTGKKAYVAMVEKSEELNQQLTQTDAATAKLIKTFVPFGGKIVSASDKMTGLADAFQEVNKAGGMMNTVQSYISRLNSNVKIVGGSLQNAFGSGLQGMLAAGKTALSALLPLLQSTVLTLLPFLPVIIAVGAALFTLQRMWANNIGGMQTFFHRFVAAISQVWNRFIVTFDKLLRTLSPVFKILFSVIFIQLMGAVNIISGLLEGLMAVITPIFEAIAEIGAVFTDLFGAIDTEGGGAVDLFKSIGGALKFIGEIIGALLRIAIIPVVWQFKMMASGLKTLLDILMPILNVIWQVFDATQLQPFIAAINLIFNTLKWIYDMWIAVTGASDKAMGIGKTKEANKAATGIAAGSPVSASQVMYNQQRNTTVNNNQSVAVHSGGAISPESAPFIGDIISRMLSSQVKV